MVGAPTDGYCDTGSERMPITPASMTNIAITHAKMGRSIKNLAIFAVPYLDLASEADLASGLTSEAV